MRLTTNGILALASLFIASSAHAQGYPNKPIRMIIPAGPGTLDIVTRAVSQKLSESMGQPVVVEGRPGATTAIGEEMVARSSPDGYTLVTSGLPLATGKFLANLGSYDPQRDLDPVSLMATAGNVLVVNPSLPVKTVRELVDYAKTQTQNLFYGTPSRGATGHLAAEMFNQMTGTRFQQVPYKGSALSLQDLIAGQIHMTFDNIPTAAAFVRSGKLRALAVTSAKRSPLMPDVPTMMEAGLAGYQINAWFGILAPAKTPVDILNKLSAETAKAITNADVKERFANLGFEPVSSTPEEFRRFIAAEAAKFGPVIRAAGMKPE